MASLAPSNIDIRGAVEAAMAELVRVTGWRDTIYVNLPLIFASGTAATVRISAAARGFRVDDGGFAYREIEAIGCERSFPKEAKKVADENGVSVNRRLVYVECGIEQLERAICDVGMASRDIVERVFRRIADREEAEIEDNLRERLERVFGSAKIDENQDIIGSSTIEWKVSAIVRDEGRMTVFQAVSPNGNSVNKASTAFHDLAQLPTPLTCVAVVKDRDALGPKINLLAQAGRIIQSDQPDEVYVRAAA